MRRGAAPDPGRDDGVAIIAAVWIAGFVALIAVSVMQMTRTGATTIRDQSVVAQLGAATEGAVNATILAMLGPEDSQPSVMGRSFTVTIGERKVRVTVLDEAGKIDINRASDAVFTLLLTAAGAARAPTSAVVRAVMRQRNPPENPPGGSGEGGDVSGYTPRNTTFQNIGDLRLLPGMTPALFERIAPMLTVYSQAADVNPTFATDEVLNLFSTVSPVAQQALEARQVARRHDREPPQSQGVALGHAYTIIAEATDPGAQAVSRQTAVVRLTGQRDAPLLVYRWD